MNFDYTNYNENVEYCKYVFQKNIEMNLGLDIPDDIQIVANFYVDEVLELQDGHLGDEVVENDLLLIQVVKEYVTTVKVPKLDSESLDYEPMQDDELKLYSEGEKLRTTFGGHGMDDNYDDYGLDEQDFNDDMKL